MTSFGRYAELYDSFYADKDYSAEADDVLRRLRGHVSPLRTVLELGAGTGNYSRHLAAKGLEVTGLELSPGMLARARALGTQGIDYQLGDLRQARLGRSFDAVIALFHVASYQVADADLGAMFETVRAHLRTGGVFCFDAWFGPGVEADPPVCRVKHASYLDRRIRRVATPTLRASEHRVDVRFDFAVERGDPLEGLPFSEVHPMRYLYLEEVRGLCERTGFELLACQEWMTGRAPGPASWYVLFTLRRVDRVPEHLRTTSKAPAAR